MHTLTIEDLHFEVRWSPCRKTVGITIDRAGELILTAPVGFDASKLEAYARNRLFWIYTKLAEKDTRRHPFSPKEFVTGEGFWYLGRSYRLLIVDEQDVPLLLLNGRFRLRRDAIGAAQKHFVQWYIEHANPWVAGRVNTLAGRVGAKPTRVAVRDLGNRWGSCGKGNVVYLNWAVILLPARIVEYLIVHELVHLLIPHHTPEFWRRVERVVPDYLERKAWLAIYGITYMFCTRFEDRDVLQTEKTER